MGQLVETQVQYKLEPISAALRSLSVDMVEAAASGHPGMPLGAADIVTVLFTRILKMNPADPQWPDRDRFVLSAGHASALLYAALFLSGYPLALDELKRFRQLGSRTSGHPEYDPEIGIECTTGPLGQGVGMGVGMAVAESVLAARHPEVCDHRTWILAGEGCLMEGISHEACSLAGRLGLDKLTLIFDDNNNTIDGRGDLSSRDDHLLRFNSYGWDTMDVDGHDFDALEEAFLKAGESCRPVFIRCRTRIGKFSPLEDSHAAHGSVLGAERAAATYAALGRTEGSFTVDDEVLHFWRSAGERSRSQYKKWLDRLKSLPADERPVLHRDEWDLSALDSVFSRLKGELDSREAAATRTLSGRILEAISGESRILLGGSADLAGPTCTRTSRSVDLVVTPGGDYIHYGVREHAMGAVMNGIALHGPFIPYGGTFLAFADYMKPAIRLSAMMKQRVIFVMSHDSIAIGEDGPTHQPIEQLSSYRSLPDLLVIRPADLLETAEAWEIALKNPGPTMLLLTRLDVAPTGQAVRRENLSARGAYRVISAEMERPELTLIASGSELPLVMEAARELAEDFPIDVVSMPCLEKFLQASEEYRADVLRGRRTIVVEAASLPGWEQLDPEGISFLGIESFGASGKRSDLLEQYGFTKTAVVDRIRTILKQKGAK